MLQTEDELIKGCLKGNQKAQRALYEKYGALLYRVCLRYLQNPMDAEDSFQLGFVKIYSNLNKFENRGANSLFFWMKRIMSNTCLNCLRDLKKNPTHYDINADIEYEDNHTEDISRTDFFDNIDPEEVYEIIKRLPDGYRAVFNMYAFEEYSHAEIAEILQISISTSKTQLMKARRAIIAEINYRVSLNGKIVNNKSKIYEISRKD